MSITPTISPNPPIYPATIYPATDPSLSTKATPVAFSPLMPIDPLITKSTATVPTQPYSAPIYPSMTSLEQLQHRWFPKQMFNMLAPPQDQIASPFKLGILAGLLTLPIMLGIPFGTAAFIWQNQRNADAFERLRKTSQVTPLRQATVMA